MLTYLVDKFHTYALGGQAHSYRLRIHCTSIATPSYLLSLLRYTPLYSAMADSDRDPYSKVKPIKLAAWNAEEFLLWQRMVTLTFRIHGVWSIVNGSEPMPTPPTPPTPAEDNAMGNTTSVDASFTRSLEDWRRRNTLACEALVNCVKGHELRHISVMENAHDM